MRILGKNRGITLIALIITIIVLLILAGVSLSLVAGGNGIISKAGKAIDATVESTAVEEIQLIIAEANMQYYLDENVTNETLAEYLVQEFNPRQTGSGAEVTFNNNGIIQYEGANGTVILLEMDENGKVDITDRADGTKIEKTVTYNANGGTGNVPEAQTFERKATVNVDFSAIPTREGYKFLGWATTSNATTAQYTQSGTKQFTMGTSNVMLYAVWVKYGKLSEKITPEDYGKTINYSANGITDWKIFFNDGTNVFLITSDYFPVEKVPTESTELITLEKYQVYWGFSDALNYQTISNDTLNLFKATGYALSSEKTNSKAVSTLLNTSNWASFVDTNKADCAIGSPTVEMWVESWNAKGYKKLYCDTTNEYGYYVGEKPNAPSMLEEDGYEYNRVIVTGTEGYYDKLYYPYYDQLSEYGLFGECSGMLLASPCADTTGAISGFFNDGYYLIRVELRGEIGDSGWSWDRHALRPVVCLKSEMIGTIGEEVVME